MKKIGFVGAFEKTDLIIYIAKILTQQGKRILFVDTTMLQKARYIAPAIEPTKTYITTYEEIDIAVGFKDLASINEYWEDVENIYDILLIDIDSPEMFIKFDMLDATGLYFVTAFDNFSLKRGLEIINSINLKNKIKMTKVFFEREIHDEYEEYLNLLSNYSSIEWDKEKIYFPYDLGDTSAIIENQRQSEIKIKNLSEEYREALFIIAHDIAPEVKVADMKKAIKKQ